MTTIFVSGANRWPPLGACNNNEPPSTDVRSVIKHAQLRTGPSESNVHSVQVAWSAAAAAAYCGSPDNFISVLAEWIDTSDLTMFLIVRVGHDVGIQCDDRSWHGRRGYC